jgi:membrane protease YdiL (CAAX protease family)
VAVLEGLLQQRGIPSVRRVSDALSEVFGSVIVPPAWERLYVHRSDLEAERSAIEDALSLFSPQASAGGMSPILSPPWRVLLYIAVLLIGEQLGGFLSVLMGDVWVLARHGYFSEELWEREAGIYNMTYTFGVYPVVILLTLVTLPIVDRRPLGWVGVTSHRWKWDLGLGLAIGAAIVVGETLLHMATGWLRLSPAPFLPGQWVALTLMCLMVGCAEELVFRGYLLTVLEEWRGRTVAILLSAVAFWSIHLGSSGSLSPWGIGFFLTFSVALSLCRYATGSLWLPIGIHAAFDWVLFSIGAAPEQRFPSLWSYHASGPAWWVGTAEENGAASLCFDLLLLAGIYLFLYRPRIQLSKGRAEAGTQAVA